MSTGKTAFKWTAKVIVPLVVAALTVVAGGAAVTIVLINQHNTINNLNNSLATLQQTTVAPDIPAVATPTDSSLPAQGPFGFPMPQTPQAGYFFVIDFYYPGKPGTGYRIISRERPSDLDFSIIKGNWYLESSKIRLAESNIQFRALQERQGAQCVIDDRLDSQSP